MNSENLTGYWDKATDYIFDKGPTILLALIVLIIGLRIIRFIVKLVNKGLEKRKVDQTLRPFISGIAGWGLKILLFVSVASMIGIATTSFVAIIGAAGLAVGLALQGTLANFAGGVLIMLFKPFKVGDLIEAQGYLGVVEEIHIFVTKILTLENRLVIISNGTLSNSSMTNHSAKTAIRVNLTLGIAYDEDIKEARKLLLEVMDNHPKVLDDPEPMVGVSALADSAIELAVRPWCHPDDYWEVYFDILEQSKEALDTGGITIPFPQRDVHLFQHTEEA